MRAHIRLNFQMGQLELLLTSAIASTIPGQLVRIPIFGQEGWFTLSDIFVLILAVAFLFYFFFNRIVIVVPKKLMLPVAIFSLFATPVCLILSFPKTVILFEEDKQISLALK